MGGDVKWLLSLFMVFHCNYSQAYMDTLAVKSNIHSENWMWDASFKCKWIEQYYPDRAKRIKHWNEVAKEYGMIVVECCQCSKYLRLKGTQGAMPGVSSSYCDECARELLYKEELPQPIKNVYQKQESNA